MDNTTPVFSEIYLKDKHFLLFKILFQKALITFSFILFSIWSGEAKSFEPENNSQKSFEWVFGKMAEFDQGMMQKVLSGQPGKRFYVDLDRDGKPEEVWFVDIDPRHNEKKRPVLVRAIDKDDDLTMGGEPDLDSDLYLIDWNADGTIDAAVDYDDLDGDQDVDQMEMYFYGGPRYGLLVWWSRDDGDDNLLWADIDFLYYQVPCQNNTHFGGDESFSLFSMNPGEDHWTPFEENPFLFFDVDRDGVTEEAIRVSGAGNSWSASMSLLSNEKAIRVLGEEDLIRTLRWSFDVDDDATKEHPRDFDVSISAYAKGWSLEKNNSDLHFRKAEGETLTIQGFPAGPILKRVNARSFFSRQTWARVLMAWDENDLNISGPSLSDTIERWEGVIAAPSTEKGYEMPAVGGPDCGPFNKRYELVLSPKGPNDYYFNPADHRIHLKNSDKTWIKVDYNHDNKMDMYYLWTDTDKDGIMDHISVDVDGDGQTDDFRGLDVSGIKTVEWTFKDLNSTYAPVISNEPENLYLLNKALNGALGSIRNGSGDDPVWDLIEHKMSGNFQPDLARRLINSDETMLYYLTLSGDRRITKLKRLYAAKSFWNAFDLARSKGDTRSMTDLLISEFKLPSGDHYRTWLSALRTVPKKKRVAWDNKWFPPNWGWESEKAAFRCYDGHFDLFGKRLDSLILPDIASAKNYHLDQNSWGMDILHVGKTGGCGGLVLYVNDVAYPLRNENNPDDPVYTAKLLKETTDTVTIEFTVTGVGPKETPYTVYIRPSAIAGRPDSPVEVFVTGDTQGRDLKLGIVLNVLPQEDFFLDKRAGVMGLWGFQQPEIGWIGAGIIFPADRFLYLDEQAEEHRVVLSCKPGEYLHYHIQGDWLRGHRFSRCPGTQEWLNTLKKTAVKVSLK